MDEKKSGGWWSDLLQAAKEKSSEALEFVKKDLTEFSTTVQADSKTALHNVKENLNQENVTAATNKAKSGVSSFLGGISKVLTVEAEDLHQKPVPASQHVFNRAQARLNAIQLDETTYVSEPQGPRHLFDEWLQTFELDSKKGDISELLVSNVHVRSLYTQLVPSAVSHADFWQRYFYRLHQLEEDEARRAALKRRAEASATQAAQHELHIDTDDDWVDMSGPSSPPAADSHMRLHDAQAAATSADAVTSDGANDALQQRLSPDVAEAVAVTAAGDAKASSTCPDAVSATADVIDRVQLTNNGSEPGPDSSSDSSIVVVGRDDVGDVTAVEKSSQRATVAATTDTAADAGKDIDDWDEEFDVTEEDIKLAQTVSNEQDQNDDWEAWD